MLEIKKKKVSYEYYLSMTCFHGERENFNINMNLIIINPNFFI